MNFRPALLLLVLYACSVLNVVGQCDITAAAVIEDVSSGTIEIFIEGAANDNLSNLDQGLCGIELFFEHTSIQDISISLESPAGQQVILVGPATGAGGNTQFTYWGVDFVPCDSTSNPDLPILDEIFTTEDNWGIFGDYDGEYYPQQGCLEDFNVGSVNGIWTVNFEDVQNFDTGFIDSIGLIFCDPTDIDCMECLANGGTLSGSSSDFCESDPNLNLNIIPSFEDGNMPDESYDYNYIILQNDEVIQTSEEPDLSGFAFGGYQVCGLSTLDLQTDEILEDIIGTEYNNILDLFQDSNYCAELSSNCLNINIIEVPDTILITDTICFGEIVVLDGNEYSESGEYVISFSEAFCDSVSILDLLVIDNQAEIVADSEQISCSDGDVLLDASNSITSSNTILNWFKVDGSIDPAIESDISITVAEAGTYGLSLSTGICTDTAYVVIENDDSIPSFSFDVDTLSCFDPSVTIDMTPSIPLQNVQWTGPVQADTEDIVVAAIGVYYVEGMATNGCIGQDSIEVFEDFEVPVPVLFGDTITCAVDTVSIFTTLPDSISYDYDWVGPNIVDESTSGDIIQVTQDTTYILNLQNMNNGCIEQFQYTIQIDTLRTNFTVESSVINCNFLDSELSVSPSIASTSYEWEFDGENIGSGTSITVDEIGEYKLVTTTSNGCVDSLFHIVLEDFDVPDIIVEDVTISCLMDSIQMLTSTTDIGVNYSWNGPVDFQSNEASPFVSNPGDYILVSSLPNGCISRDTVEVEAGDGLPDVTFQASDILDCNVDIVTITPSDTLNLSFVWQSTSVISDVNAFIVDVDQSGIYQVLVTDTLSGCNLIYDVPVGGSFALPEAEIDYVNFDCVNTQVTLNTSFSVDIDSLRWTNDAGFDTNEQSPTITEDGEYFLVVYGSNGCNYNDTITVTENTLLPDLITTVPLLDCLNSSVDISFTTQDNTDSLGIRLPDGTFIEQSSLTVSEPGEYMAIASTLAGCVDSTLMEVLIDTTAAQATLVSNGIISCAQPTTVISIDYEEEGLIFDWSGGSIISPLGLDSIVVDTDGLYNVIVTDTSNCSLSLDINIESLIDYPIVQSTVDTINCTQDVANIELLITDNIVSIIWDGPSTIEDNLTSFSVSNIGTYTATVTADNDCVTTEEINVVIDTIVPVIDISANGILTCNSPDITLSSNSDIAGSSFNWSGPNNLTFDTQNIDINQAGTYDLIVTAPNTCLADTFIVVEVDTLSPTIVTGDDPIFSCSDGKVSLTVETTTNIISYQWDGPLGFESEFAEPLAIAPGVYNVTVTNDIGCSSSASINVIDDTEGPEIMVRDTFITCDMLAVPLPLQTNDMDVSFVWDSPGFSSELQNPETNVVGQYIVYALADNECVTVDTVDVTFQEISPIYEVESGNINCYQSVTTLSVLDAEDDLSVTWTDSDYNFLAMDSLVVSSADSFYVVVVATNACADTTKVIVGENADPDEIEILLNEPFQCENTDVTLYGNVLEFDLMDQFVPSWTTIGGNILAGDQTFEAEISGEGTYILSVFNSVSGCESFDTLELVIEEQSLLGISLEGQDPNCIDDEDGIINVTNIEGGFKPFEYRLNGISSQLDSSFVNLGAGVFTIQVEDSVGCVVELDLELFEGLEFIANAEQDTLIVVGDRVDLISLFNVPDDEISEVSWTSNRDDYDCDGCFEAPVSPLFSTLYTLEATTIEGCVDTSQVFVQVIRNPKIEVANVFAPGSTENGLFFIQQTRGVEKVLSMSIFDKWASRMFYEENVDPGDPAGAWDGTYLGRDVNPGVYVVVAELLLYSGEVVTYAGDITLIR